MPEPARQGEDGAALARSQAANQHLRGTNAHLRCQVHHLKAALFIRSEREWARERRGMWALMASETATVDETGFSEGIL